MFTFLVFAAAFLLEAIGTYVSVVGLGHLFAYSVVVMIMAAALDVAKIAGVTFLYRHWQEIGWTLRSYLLSAMFVLMIITSSGVFGFLSGEFQKAITGTSQQAVVIQTLTGEQARLQKRKEEIDQQIAQLPQNSVRGRRQLMQQFAPEVERLNARLEEIDKRLPELRVESIGAETHVGPILYVAKAFDTTPEEAVKWVIFAIMGVFDPLAIALLIAGNFLLDLRKKKAYPADDGPIKEEVIKQIKAMAKSSIIDEDTPVSDEVYNAAAMDLHLKHPFKVKKPRRKKVADPTPVEKVVIKPTVAAKSPRKVTTVMDGEKEVIKFQPPPLMRSILENSNQSVEASLGSTTISAHKKTYED